MRINNLNLQGIDLKENLKLREGMTVRGEVKEISDNTVLINIKGYGNLEVDLDNIDVDLERFLGEVINFLIKDISDNTVTLKALLEESQLGVKSEEDNLLQLLKDLKIPDTEDNREIIKLLMENKLALNDKNLGDVLKNFNKLEDLINLTEDEDIELINPKGGQGESKTDNTDVGKLLVNKDETLIVQKEKLDFSREELKNIILYENEVEENLIDEVEEFILSKTENINEDMQVDKKERLLNSDIKNILVSRENVDKPETLELKEVLKEALDGKEFISKLDSKKMFVFFAKNDIRPTLNNVMNFIEFTDNPSRYIKEFTKERKELLQKLGIEEKASDKLTVDMLKREISEIKEKIGITSNLKEDLKNLENKLNFIKDLNKDMTFMFMPIHTEMEKYKGLLSFMKENNKKSMDKNKINVFIDLNTHNLGNVKISCTSVGNNLSINLQIEEEDLKLFKDEEINLVERIEKLGYKLSNISYTYGRDLKLIEDLVNEKNTNYFLDIKV